MCFQAKVYPGKTSRLHAGHNKAPKGTAIAHTQDGNGHPAPYHITSSIPAQFTLQGLHICHPPVPAQPSCRHPQPVQTGHPTALIISPTAPLLATYWMQPLGPHRLPPDVGPGLSYLSPTTLLVMLQHITPNFIARVVMQVLLLPQEIPSSCSGRANAVTSALTRHDPPPIGHSSCTCCQGCGL